MGELKGTTYFSSKSRVLSVSPEGPLAVGLALATTIAAYLMAYSAAMRVGLVPGVLIALGGLGVFAAEAAALELAWGRGYRFVDLRRLSVAYAVSNAVWIILLIPAAALGRASLAALSVFPFWAFRAYVIGAVFSQRTPRALSAIISTAPGPAYNLALGVQRLGSGSLTAVALGLPVLAVAGVSLALLERGRVNGLSMLAAFLEAWSGSRGELLEGLMYELGEDGNARGFLLGTSRFVIAVPYVHPGPFRPVGSYDLPGRLAAELGRVRCSAVLHGAVDHGRNLASSRDSRRFAAAMARAAPAAGAEGSELRWPVAASGERVRLRGIWVGSSSLLLIAEPARGLEDYGDEVVERVEELGRRNGVKVVLVDAHNSLGPDPGEEEVSELLSLAESIIRRGPPEERVERCGCASRPGAIWPDVGSAGVSAIVLEGGGRRFALVAVDSNNAMPGLREELGRRLSALGIDDYVLCTTDTHETTGVSDFRRGYSALGEAGDGALEAAEGVVRSAMEALGPCDPAILREFSMRARFAGGGFLNASMEVASRSLSISKAALAAALALTVAGYAALALL